MSHIFKTVESLYIYITNDCQLSCEYCNHCKNDSHMSIDTANIIIDEILKSDIKEVVFFGGEPLLNFPILKHFIEKLSKKIHLGFTTNGIALKGEIASFLAEHIEVGIQISIDPDMEFRTKIYNNTIMENIRDFIQKRHFYGGYIEANSVVSLKDYEYYVKEFYTYLTEDIGFDLVNTNLSGDIVEELGKEIESWLLKGYRPPSCAFDGFIRAHYENNRKIGGCFYCKACSRDMTIGFDGSIYACYQFHNFGMFRIGHIASGIDSAKRREWFTLQKQRLLKCKECDYFKLCLGACPYNHYIETHEISVNGEGNCYTRKRHFDMGKKIYENILSKGSVFNLAFLRSDRLWTGYNTRFFTDTDNLQSIYLDTDEENEMNGYMHKKDEFNIYPFGKDSFTLYVYKKHKLYKISNTLACILEVSSYDGVKPAIAYIMKIYNVPIANAVILVKDALINTSNLLRG